MSSRGAQRRHLWFVPAEFEVFHFTVDVKQDIAKTGAFDVDDGANVSTSQINFSSDEDGVFVLFNLLLLYRFSKPVGKCTTWSRII
jgi:hypothetical protein